MAGPAGPIGSTENPHWLRPLSQGGRALLELLLKEGPSSQASMAGRLGLSQPSIARLVGDFREQELVTLSERKAEGRGNPSVLVNLNPDFAYGLGLSLAGDAVSLCLLDLQGRVRAAETQAMATMDRASVIDAIKTVRARVLRKARVDASRIAGAGVAFSGFFVGPPLRFNPPRQLEAWSTLDVAAELREVLGVSVVAENDGSAAAVAEALLGVGRRCSTFAYCNLTNGFGGGLMDHGRLVRGFLGNAGDFGGVVWLLGGSYPSLENLKVGLSAAGADFGSVEEMVRKVTLETPGVAGWIAEASEPLGKLAFLLGHISAPEKIVIGGRLPRPLAQALAASVAPPSTPARNGAAFPLPEVVASEVEGDAAATGAALLPLQHLFFN